MDWFDNNAGEPLLPVSMDDVTLEIFDAHFAEQDFITNLYEQVKDKDGLVSRSSFKIDMIPFSFGENDQDIWWLPREHPVLGVVVSEPLGHNSSSKQWGDLVVYDDQVISGAIEQLVDLCEKYELVIDETKDNKDSKE